MCPKQRGHRQAAPVLSSELARPHRIAQDGLPELGVDEEDPAPGCSAWESEMFLYDGDACQNAESARPEQPGIAFWS